MNIIGIIVEYNPFHNGHLYHINKIKELYPQSIIIAVMSGNFTQRGEMSIINKWDKTSIALEHNIDIVVELPFHYATQSADLFAKGSIEILNGLHIDTLVFGSESNNVDKLTDLARTSLNDSNYDKNIKKYLNDGLSYPAASLKSLNDLTSESISTPNDILGVSYIKEIIKQNQNIQPISIKRTNDYHSLEIDNISSASSIRNALRNNIDISNTIPATTSKYLNSTLFFLEDYYHLLKYKILSTTDLSIYQSVDEGIENRIKNMILNSNTLDELINNIKTKRYTYNKIRRMLLHILIGFTKEEAKKYKNINYIRVLGFNDVGQSYLNKIKKNVNIPIITNFNKYKDILDLEYRSTTIYASILNNELKLKLIKHEYNQPIKKTLLD